MDQKTSNAQLDGILEFLRATERLKVVTRSAYTSEGKQETVAEHSWRLCLMALVCGVLLVSQSLRLPPTVPAPVEPRELVGTASAPAR